MSAEPDGGLDPLDLAALIATRLCHDMAGPVGAVANGAELLGDDPAMIDAEALGLLTGSAAGASLRLRTLRAAFGLAGAVEPGDLPRQLAAWAGPRCSVTLPPRDALTALAPEPLRLLLNLALLATETTVAPATLVVEVAGDRLAAAAEGRAPRLEPAMAEAVAGRTDGLGPRTVQAWLTGALGRRLGGTVAVAATASGSTAAIVLPQG